MRATRWQQRLGRLGLVWLVLWLTGCGGQPQVSRDGKIHVGVRLIGEDGAAVDGGWLERQGERVLTDERGEAQFALSGPELLLAAGPEMLPEPVVLGARDDGSRVTVKLWASREGSRRALHFGGDVMFARRYLEPSAGDPLLTPGAAESGAELVVERIARAFAAADLSIVNLETAVSNLPTEAAYPGKRFLLNSSPESLAGLRAMGVDIVGLANNHTRDWLEPGLLATLAALDERGISHVGAGLDDESARKPVVTSVGNLKIATLAYTSVNGSFVNDNYPVDAAPAPAAQEPNDAWIWQPRAFSSADPGFVVEAGSYRIGEMWARYAAVEDALTQEQRAVIWTRLVGTYPELQDWVARRGHGGAAYYVTGRAKADIEQAKSNADIAVVLLHAGYQFQDVASETVTTMAHAAIDAGADLVVCHHPHVLQGVEYYQGKLIVYSLGNFVFDQDFFSTFSTGFLRTIWEDNHLLEARFVPAEIADYRPSVVADQAADRVFQRLWESSVAPARSARVATGVYPIVTGVTAEPPRLWLQREWGTARFRQDGTPTADALKPGSGIQELPADRLLRIPAGQLASTLNGWRLGRELLGWGHFEDVLADGVDAFGQNYVDDHADKNILTGDAANGRAFLRLTRNAKKKDALYMRPVARVALPRHRLYKKVGDDASAADSEPTYSIRAMVRGKGELHASFRIDSFQFDDSNPTEDPTSQALASLQIPISKVGSRFESIEIPVTLSTATDGVIPNMVMIYVGLAPPISGDAEFDIDDIQWVEWRDAAAIPPNYGAFNCAQSLGAAAELKVEWLESQR